MAEAAKLKGRQWTPQAIKSYLDTGELPPFPRRPIPKDIRIAVWHRDGGVCGLCGQPADPLDWSCDHIVPQWLDGPTIIDNLRVTHPRGNRTRTDPRLMSQEEIEEAADDWTANEIERIWPSFQEFIEDRDAAIARLEAEGVDADLIAGYGHFRHDRLGYPVLGAEGWGVRLDTRRMGRVMASPRIAEWLALLDTKQLKGRTGMHLAAGFAGDLGSTSCVNTSGLRRRT